MIYVITLAYNLVSEVEKATKRLYEQNEKKFVHYIVGLGFPLIKGDEIPENIPEAQKQNSESLKELSKKYGSKFAEMKNIGCSQNWTKVYNHIKPRVEDCFISCEPDEVQLENGWVNAMANALRGGLAYCAPHLIEHGELLAKSPYAELKIIGGEEVYAMLGNLNYGQVGYSGTFLNIVNGVPVPKEAFIYGYIESALQQSLEECNMKWGLLKNYTTEHTDYEKGTVGASKLLREWKNYLILEHPEIKQQSLESWLIKKKNNEL